MSFENFPYTNFHDLNLDWIIKKVKEAYSPDNPPENVVISVNGETGEVVLYRDAVVRLPSVDETTWAIFRKSDNTDEGIQFIKGQKAQRIDGTNRYDIYDSGNPPAYPVTSVNGDTGAVVCVKSVNGATGVVTLYPNAVIHFPDVDETVWGMYRKADGTDEGIQFIKGQKAQRIDGVNRYDVYDSGNPPPYPVSSVNTLTGAVAILDTTIVTDGNTQKIKITFPVTSVDGATGAVTTWGNSGNAMLKPPVEAQGDIWGFERDIPSGTLGIELDYDDTEGEASGYIVFDDGTNPATRIKLLTPDDIPSSSGVVSFNGQTGAVTCTGADLAVSGNDSTKIDVALGAKATKVSSPTAGDIATLDASGNLVDSGVAPSSFATKVTSPTAGDIATLDASGNIVDSGKKPEIFAQNSELDIVVNGDSATVNITAGDFVTVRNSTITGITDGMYKAVNNISANTALSSSDLTAVTSGALNSLNSNITALDYKLIRVSATANWSNGTRNYFGYQHLTWIDPIPTGYSVISFFPQKESNGSLWYHCDITSYGEKGISIDPHYSADNITIYLYALCVKNPPAFS